MATGISSSARVSLKKTGAELLPDPTVIDLYGTPTLLMHGDTLCTDDVEYQMVRRMLRDPPGSRTIWPSPWWNAAPSPPMPGPRAAHTAAKAEYIMDVNQRAVEAAHAQHRSRG